jgi:hypothetical protein
MSLGLKAQFYSSGDELLKQKGTKRVNVFDSWAERMQEEGKSHLLSKNFSKKQSTKLRVFAKMGETKDL